MGGSRFAAAALGVAVLLGVMPPVGAAGAAALPEAQPPLETVAEAGSLAAPVSGTEEGSAAAGTVSVSVSDGAPVLGAGFVLSAERVSAGVARLDWNDVAGADGFEVMALVGGRWLLLPAGGVSVHFDGSSTVVAGLVEPVPDEGWWFAVRARNSFGLSRWSASVQAAVPAESAPLFDPFTAPTRSGIDLERLREATATIDTTSDCDAAPALGVAGVTVVAAPASLSDPDAALTVAEVVRIAGGCLLVDYVRLDGRSVEQMRTLLAAEGSVLAVGEPARGVSVAHDNGAHAPHTGGHYDDGGGVQWHLPRSAMTSLWKGWLSANPVTVAVLDSGVDKEHPDLADAVVSTAAGCDVDDATGHGTWVAGVIAAKRDPNASPPFVAGVAPLAKVHPIRVDIDGLPCSIGGIARELATPPQAIARAVNSGVRLINMSISGDRRLDNAKSVAGIRLPTADTYELTVRAAAMLGTVMVAAVGNCGDDGDDDGDGVPNWGESSLGVVGCSEHHESRQPAQFPGVISVAAVKRDGTRLAASSVNSDVDIAAPGSAILTTDRCAPVCDTTIRRGTSMAAPFVSGVVAHMLNRRPGATPGQIREALESSAAHPTLARGQRDDEYGRGIVRPAGALTALKRMFEALEPQGTGRAGGGFTGMSAGGSHTCGVRENGAVHCWGGPEAVVSGVPRVVFSLVSASPGTSDVIAARTLAEARTHGVETEDFDPVEEAARAAALNVTYGYACGVRAGDGTVNCWGDRHPQMTAASAVLEDPGAPGGRFEQVATGNAHACGLRPSGRVVCWGDSTRGQTDVPADSFGSVSAPRLLFNQISAGSNHTCGVTSAGSVRCWGYSGNERTAVPAALRMAGSVLAVSAGGRHTCAVRSDRSVLCWGDNSKGQTVVPVGEFRSISAGLWHTCGVLTSGRSVCWGYNGPVGAEDGRIDVPAGAFLSVAAGGSHSCGVLAVRPTFGVRCWGDDGSGQAPQGLSRWRLASLALTGADGADLLAQAGGFDAATFEYTAAPAAELASVHAVAADAGGPQDAGVGLTVTIRPADARTDDPTLPAPNDTLGHQVSLAVGSTVTVEVAALFGFGPLRTYTISVPPQLSTLSVRAETGEDDCPGAGCPPYELIPAFDPAVTDYRVVVPADVGLVTVGYSAADGVVTVSPPDARPPLSGSMDPTPGHQVALSTDRDFKSVSAGGSHSCGVKSDATVACWGPDGFGASFVPSGSFSSVSAGASHTCGVKTDNSVVCWGFDGTGRSVAPSGSFISVSAGVEHSCGVKSDGSVLCWGSNRNGRSVAPSGSFSSVSAGGFHSCGVKSDGSVVCWGIGLGRAEVPKGAFVSVSAGYEHSCGVKSDNSVVCWGGNSHGQSVAPSGSFISVSAGVEHSCGVKSDGSVLCWGSNRNGQSVVPSGSFRSVSADWFHSCGVKSDATVVCWGANSHGQSAMRSGSFSSVSAGHTHSCGVKAGSTAVCWGGNSHGQSVVPSGSFISVSAGYLHSCGVKSDNSVVCWGSNRYGESVVPSDSFTSVSVGGSHSCGVKFDRSVVCWGSNFFGQSVVPSGSFASVSAGGTHSCGVKTDASVVCWGERFAILEPAKSQRVTVEVASSPSSAVGVYTVLIERPAPALPAAQTAGAHGRGASGAHRRALIQDGPRDCIIESECTAARELCATLGQQCPQPDANFAAASFRAPGASDARAGGAAGAQGTAPAACPSENTETDAAVTISDAVLRAAVEAALGKQAGAVVTVEELAGLSELRLPRLGSADASAASSLSGLEHAASLTVLDLSGHNVSDISPLRCLTGLETLVLSGNPLNGVSALSGPSSLDTLWLDRTGIADVSGLSAMSGLERLYLHGNRIADVSGLVGLTSLTDLELSHNAVSDISGLSTLVGLDVLGVGGNQISSITSVSGLSGLEALYVFDNRVTDVSALSGLGSLETLWASGNRITDASTVGSLTGLDYADVRFNRVSDISPLTALAGTVHARPQQADVVVFEDRVLAGAVRAALGLGSAEPVTKTALGGLWSLRHGGRGGRVVSLEGLQHATSLEELYLSGNRVRDLSPLASLERLRVLELGDNGFTDLAQLAQLPALRRVDLVRNGITSLDTLPALPRLELLGLDLNAISDIAPLAALSGLREIRLTSNRVSDLTPLSGLRSLHTVSVSNNPLTSLAPLAGLDSLRVLRAHLIGVADLSPLAGLTGLQRFYAGYNGISDLSSLAGMTGLAHLHLRDNQISDITPLAGLTKLELVRLDDNQISDITALGSLTALVTLDIASNQIASIAPLRKLTKLRTLSLAHNRITDFTPIYDINGLRVHGKDDQQAPAGDR